MENYLDHSFVEYKSNLVKGLNELHYSLDDGDEIKIHDDEFEILMELLDKLCDKNYSDYLIGLRDSYEVTEDEFMDLHKEANLILVSNSLISLSDKGFINVSIGSDGELRYSLSEYGKLELEKIKGGDKC